MQAGVWFASYEWCKTALERRAVRGRPDRDHRLRALEGQHLLAALVVRRARGDGLLEVLRSGRVLAIPLVDLRLLHARAARTSLLPRSYTGHYVLLVGAEGARVRSRAPAAARAERSRAPRATP